MEPVSWCILTSVALARGASTFLVKRHVSSGDDERLKEQINSQIVILQEKDNSHEFAQLIILCLISIN